jgi:hypothetical protein
VTGKAKLAFQRTASQRTFDICFSMQTPEFPLLPSFFSIRHAFHRFTLKYFINVFGAGFGAPSCTQASPFAQASRMLFAPALCPFPGEKAAPRQPSLGRTRQLEFVSESPLLPSSIPPSAHDFRLLTLLFKIQHWGSLSPKTQPHNCMAIRKEDSFRMQHRWRYDEQTHLFTTPGPSLFSWRTGRVHCKA